MLNRSKALIFLDNIMLKKIIHDFLAIKGGPSTLHPPESATG